MDLCSYSVISHSGVAHTGVDFSLLSSCLRSDLKYGLLYMNEVATGTIWAESISMECSAEFSLIFGVTGEYAKILAAMCKLTLVSILAVAILLKVSAELCLVA